MLSVTDLLQKSSLPDNYFLPRLYVKSDLELGLLENRSGNRLLAIPDTLIKALYRGLEQETGLASRLVLYNCGRWWGKNFFGRLRQELRHHFGRDIGDLSMAEFLDSLGQCWAVHGWGRIELDPSYSEQGFLLIQTWNSPCAAQAPPMQRPVCFLDAGILASLFGQLCGQELSCVQISCESLGADCNRFLVGLEVRLDPVTEQVENGLDYGAILTSL